MNGPLIYDLRKYWKMQNGELIEISKMANHHLINTIKMCKRNRVKNLDNIQAGLGASLQGEMANDYLDQAIDDATSYDFSLMERIETLSKEAEKRGLTVPK